MRSNIDEIIDEEMFIDSQIPNMNMSFPVKLILHSLRGLKQVSKDLNIDINDLNVIDIVDYIKKNTK